MSPLEQEIAGNLVDAILKRDLTISVFDGEDYPVKRETDKAVIMAALDSTELDILVVRDAAGVRWGSIALGWGNGEDLIVDHTDNAKINAIISEVMP